MKTSLIAELTKVNLQGRQVVARQRVGLPGQEGGEREVR